MSGWRRNGPGGRTLGHLAYELAAAVAIGLATVFVSKPQRDMHWSTPPTTEVADLRTTADAGDPPAPD